MSYAILRNQNYKKDQLSYIYRHNERKNTNYSNEDINKENSTKNYSIKSCNTTYSNKIKELIKEYDLKGRIIKTTNVLCEFIITSDKDFFECIGEKETKRYFKTAYDFVAQYNNLGEEFIISAKIHMDETTPHMHITFVPVMHKLDKKSGKEIYKIACSEYWKGKNSYHRLQDEFYKYMTERNFNLERGNIINNEHIPIEKLKKVTDFETQKYEMQSIKLEQEKEIFDTEDLKKEYKRVIRKFNTLAKNYTRIKHLTDNLNQKSEDIEIEYHNIKIENEQLKNENRTLKKYIDKSIEWMALVLNWPFERVNKLINEFIEKSNRKKTEEKEIKIRKKV